MAQGDELNPMINSNASVSNVRFERRAEVGHCSASLIDGEQKMGCQYHLIRIHSNEIEDSTMGPYRTILIPARYTLCNDMLSNIGYRQ